MEPVRDVCLESFDPKRHSEILKEWLHRPHVAQWWGDAQLALDSSLKHPPESCALIFSEGAPVGFLSWQKISRNELREAGLEDLPEHLVDIDILVGEPDVMGHGVGPKALRLLIEYLAASGRVTAAGVGVSVVNKRAIKAFEKTGFRMFREFEDPEFGLCQYMLIKMGEAV